MGVAWGNCPAAAGGNSWRWWLGDEPRGCVGARLDTFEFQAPGFYEKLGYTRFGRIDDHPRGYSRFFMQKRL